MARLAVIAVALALLAPGAARATITLAAPVAWAAVVNALIDSWNSSGGGDVVARFGDSDDQAIEIELGGSDYDLLLTGDPHALYRVLSKQSVGRPLALASSPLVLVVSDRHPEIGSALQLMQASRIAVVDPETDGVGVATRDLLGEHGQWDALKDRLLLLSGSKAAVRAVQRDEAQAAIALKADLLQAVGVHDAGSPLADAPAPDFLYVIAPVAASPRDEISRFLRFLLGTTAAKVIAAKGYTALRGD